MILKGVRYQLTIYSKNVLICVRSTTVKSLLRPVNVVFQPEILPVSFRNWLFPIWECKGIFYDLIIQGRGKNIFDPLAASSQGRVPVHRLRTVRTR